MHASLDWLEDPRVFRVNRLDAHSDHHWYETPQHLAAGDETLRRTLNGQWLFAYSAAPAARPAQFYEEDFDLAAFGTIQVPGHIELQGHGQIQYINTMYPWDGRSFLRPPHIDWNDDPVGSYVTFFDVPQDWSGKRMCVSFQGVEQAFYVWLNGHFVGYSEDSFTPSDFDLTPYARATGNRLCVEVYKRSSAAWLEDQDFFRFFGIFRDVYLYAKPAVHVEDMWLQAGLAEDNTTGTLSVRLKATLAQVGGVDGGAETGAAADTNAAAAASVPADAAALRVHCHIAHPTGVVLYDDALPLTKAKAAEDAVGTDTPAPNAAPALCSEALAFPDICPWSNDGPCLYNVTLTIADAAGTVHEVIPYKIGFRRFALQDGILLLNGSRLILNGVNRHEWSAERGRSITAETMRRDIATVKGANINAVRTCHYPNQSLWYDLCDENGIYLMDEANLESHGSWQKMGAVEPSWNVPGCDEAWEACVVDRAQSMFERDKNHTCVLFWSCGNESYAGSCIQAMSDFFHAHDSSRIVHYEGVFHNRAFDAISDVESRMYATPEDIRAYLQAGPGKPFILCEYMHNMGNSLGGMESYIRLLDEFPRYQGGFIWDFMDQALWRTDACGRRALGYGGDFADRPTDYSFSGNGLLFADGTEKPALEEVRYWYSAPAQRARHDAANAAARARATEQLAHKAEADAQHLATLPPLTISKGDVTLGVKGEDFEALFSYTEGGPVSLVYGDMQWLYRAPKPAFWRAGTENDKGNGFSARSAVWLAADAYPHCTAYAVEQATGERVRICYTYTLPTTPATTADVCYTVDKAGDVSVTATYHGAVGVPQLPAFGVRFATPQPVHRVHWLGLSGETYPDRYKGARFGAHIEAPHSTPHLVPQDCGCHLHTLSAHLYTQDEAGKQPATLTLTAAPTAPQAAFAFSALPYTPQELEAALHQEELPNTGRTVVTVLGAVRGVGGIDSWGADVEPAYHLSGEGTHTVSFCLRSGG